MKPPSINLSTEALSHFDDAIQKEWIITNGLGSYSSSTVLGVNTRKYHGLLVAALSPPKDRRVCLAKLDEEIIIGNNTYLLGANEFQNGIFQRGYIYLKEFSISPFPKYTYTMQDVEVQKTILMTHQKNAVVVLYKVLNKSGFDIKVRVFPLVNGRHFHSVIDRWKIPEEPLQKGEEDEVAILFSIPQSTLMLKTTSGNFNVAGKWVEKIYYREEAAHGESFLEDCYQPGYFEVGVKPEKIDSFAIITVANKNENDAREVLAKMPVTMYDIEALFEQETNYQENLLTRFYEEHENIPQNDWLSWVVLAADMFLVKEVGDDGRSVVAGYHWFGAWGRDIFVSLPGLMLVTGKFEDVREVLLTYKRLCKDGLIPNFVPEQTEQLAYNSVDATLWYVNAVLQYLKYTGDFKFVEEQIWQSMKKIITNHMQGTAFDIHVDSDGLLSHSAQLTWMDAAIDGQPITPRAGKAVEVQALWYNALRTMELLANRFKETSEAEKYAQMAEKTMKSFVDKFWDLEKNYLFDVISENERNNSLRPNQIAAIALDFGMLDNVKKEKIVDIVHRELLTPYGLRTLARNDAKYVGIYAGDRRNRDKAYHNGTVWPWLLGLFTTGFLKTKGYAEYRREYAFKNFLLPFFSEQIFKAGLGTISEVFDGEPPHLPRGCIAQAWSVAEPLRAYVEDVMLVRPKHEREVLQGLR